MRDDLRLLQEARLAFENAEFESALRLCSKAIQFNPHESAAWAGQVRALIELGEYSEASLWADKALERFPNETEIIAAKGVALARLGQFGVQERLPRPGNKPLRCRTPVTHISSGCWMPGEPQ